MNSEDIKNLIAENKDLFWFIPEHKKSDISIDVLVEFVLNYGDYDACRHLLNTLGTETVADVFFNHLQSKRRGGNYFPEIAHYFTQYFQRHAPRSVPKAYQLTPPPQGNAL